MAEVYDEPREWTGEVDAPLTLFSSEIRRGWIDEFDHVNTAHYVTIGDHANWAFWNWANHPLTTIGQREGHEYVIVESHVNYLGELTLGESIRVTTRLLDFDDRRYILHHGIWRMSDDVLAATNEVKCLAFDLGARRPERWSPRLRGRLEQVRRAHESLELHHRAGHGISLGRP